MNEYIIKLKLPSEIVIHVPALSEVGMHDMLRHISGDSAKNIIKDRINKLLVDAFMDQHIEYINSFVAKTVSEARGEDILRLVREELLKKLSE